MAASIIGGNNIVHFESTSYVLLFWTSLSIHVYLNSKSRNPIPWHAAKSKRFILSHGCHERDLRRCFSFSFSRRRASSPGFGRLWFFVRSPTPLRTEVLLTSVKDEEIVPLVLGRGWRIRIRTQILTSLARRGSGCVFKMYVDCVRLWSVYIWTNMRVLGWHLQWHIWSVALRVLLRGTWISLWRPII